jgi:hypothetical protein
VAHPENDGAIYARTSANLIDWSASRIVSYGGRGGTGKLWQAECPFVVKIDQDYFLFRTARYGQDNMTHVYRSRDPLNFGINDDQYYIGSLPVAAPEIFFHEDQWFIACLLPTLDGIRIGTLNWIPDSR